MVGRLAEGTIKARFNTRVIAVEPDSVLVRDASGDSRIPATQVYTMTGYQPETALLSAAGVPSDPVTGIPAHNPTTLETSQAGLYIAGVIVSGFDANKIFIENGRDHGKQIVASVLAQTPSPNVC